MSTWFRYSEARAGCPCVPKTVRLEHRIHTRERATNVAGKPHTTFERRTVASTGATQCATSDPAILGLVVQAGTFSVVSCLAYLGLIFRRLRTLRSKLAT